MFRDIVRCKFSSIMYLNPTYIHTCLNNNVLLTIVTYYKLINTFTKLLKYCEQEMYLQLYSPLCVEF